MSDEIKSLLEAQNKAFTEFKTSNDERLKAIETKKAVDPLLTEAIDKANKDISRLTDELKTFAAAARRPAIEVKGHDGRVLEETEVKHLKAAMTYVRTGQGADELKALSGSSDPDGGYLLPRDMSGRIVRKVFESSTMRAMCSVQTISTDALEGQVDDDELDGGWVGEQAARGETATPHLGVWRIPVHEMYFKPRATQRMLDDAAVDLEGWLGGKVADKKARKEAQSFVAGNGVDKPRGAFTYTPVLTGSGSRANKTVRTVKTGNNNDLTDADALVKMTTALKAPYRAMGVFGFSREGLEKVRLIKQDGKYLWAPSVLSIDAQAKVALQAGTILGYAAYELNDLPAFATDAIVGGFGDFKEFYQIVDRQGIRVLRDPFSSKPFVEFYTTARVGGDVLNFEAVAYLQSKA